MSASVLLSCGLSEKSLVPAVFIGESSGVDGSFLVSCLLGHQFKHRNTGVLLVCLHHSFDHYIEAGLKLGYNLAAAGERKSLVVHDVLKKLPELARSGVNLVEKCLEDIVSDLELLGQSKEHTTIILDDVSVFLNMGVTENVLLNFCRELQKFTAWHPRVTLVMKMNCTEIHHILCNYLYDFANTRISVKPLDSGKFQDVDGKMIINHKGGDFQSGEKDKVVLYRVNERNIKIFLPGEYSVSG
ncbi:elongator complex protein 6 [Phlebotomus argentipes]|uniref:elongator complex protein 6 n=1 Tax=Phlebotomus argentipes TaxID=94469 RepID=UPI00289344B5|nr:elongator complex protein 6 [Phlebotomus argentipes]XP_059610325.1 elongator complex protein 6 [Phlebotomus argentipes]XP_059610326.1 elongator complex protein 6 [Phlebotomus argentipes]